MIVTKILKVPIFVNEITFLKVRTSMWVSHAVGRRCTSFSFPCTRLMPGQEATRRCPRHLCRGRSCSVEQKSSPGLGEIFPTKVAATEKFQQKITFVASQRFVKHSIFCWKILYPLPPRHCQPCRPLALRGRDGYVTNSLLCSGCNPSLRVSVRVHIASSFSSTEQGEISAERLTEVQFPPRYLWLHRLVFSSLCFTSSKVMALPI